MKWKKFFSLLIAAKISVSCVCAQPFILKTSAFKSYIDSFNTSDNELYKQYYSNAKAWAFLEKNIPLFNCPDKIF